MTNRQTATTRIWRRRQAAGWASSWQARGLASGRPGVRPSALRPLGLALGLALLAVAGLSACGKQAPVVQLPPAPLEVPVVPPRLVGPVMVEADEPPPVETPEPAAPRARAPRPAPARPNDPVVRVDPPPDPNAKPENPGAQPGSGAAGQNDAPPLLRTPDTANDAEVVKTVRDTLTRAGANLNKIHYNGLNAGAKANHDTARRFIQQAEDALKVKNLFFARYLSDKAETLSASLLNR